MSSNTFFADTFNNLSPEELEDYHKTVIMNMDSEFAAKTRIEYYKGQLKFLGKDVSIGSGVKIINPQYVSVGDNVVIGDNCVLRATSKKGISLGNKARLNYGVYLDAESSETGYITIGERVYIGTGCCLFGHEGLEIGDDSLLAQNITITPASHTFEDPEQTIYSQKCKTGRVTIGNDCYLGMNVCVLYSADIGEGSVVGAGAVVVHPVPPYSLAVGIPARVIKKRKK